jgi:hypothetical protein
LPVGQHVNVLVCVDCPWVPENIELDALAANQRLIDCKERIVLQLHISFFGFRPCR